MGVIVKPHTFSPSTTISSSQVNSDFDTIYNEFNGNVAAANLAVSAVTTAKIADLNVTTAKIADLNVTTAKIANDSVTSTKIDWASTGTDGGIWGEELGRQTATSGDSVSVTPIGARTFLEIEFFAVNSGQLDLNISFNNDSGANYAIRRSTNGAADGTGVSGTSMDIASAESSVQYGYLKVINVTAQEKLVHGHIVSLGSAGAGSAPTRWEITGKWANTAAQITRVDLLNIGTGDFADGTVMVVRGHN